MKQYTISTLHRTLASVLLFSQLLTSCGGAEMIAPASTTPQTQQHMELSDDNPIPTSYMGSPDPLSIPDEQGYASDDSSQSFTPPTYTARRGDRIQLKKKSKEVYAEVKAQVPTGFISPLYKLPVVFQKDFFPEDLTPYSYVDVVFPSHANGNKGYVFCAEHRGLLGGMPQKHPQCKYSGDQYTRNSNSDWVCPSGEHTVKGFTPSPGKPGGGPVFHSMPSGWQNNTYPQPRPSSNPGSSSSGRGFFGGFTYSGGSSDSRRVETVFIGDFDFEREIDDEIRRRERANERRYIQVERGEYDFVSMGLVEYESTDRWDVEKDLKERRERQEREHRERQERERIRKNGMREKGEEKTPEQERISEIDRDLQWYYNKLEGLIRVSKESRFVPSELKHIHECVVSSLKELDRLGFSVVALLEVTRFARKLKDRIFVFISNSNILHQ